MKQKKRQRASETAIRIHEYIKRKKLKRCTIERSSLSPVHRNRGISPRIGPFLDLGPRRILLLLHERLSALHTVPRNLRYKIINKKNAGGAHLDKTHVTVLLASVARLDGRLGAIHIFRDGIRRSQTVPALRRYQFKHAHRQVMRVRACVPRHMVWPAAAVTLDGRERSDIKAASRRRCARRKSASSSPSTTATTTTTTTRVFYSVIRTHARDMSKVAAVLAQRRGWVCLRGGERR